MVYCLGDCVNKKHPRQPYDGLDESVVRKRVGSNHESCTLSVSAGYGKTHSDLYSRYGYRGLKVRDQYHCWVLVVYERGSLSAVF